MKKILALTLALMTMFMLCIPAMAAETSSISQKSDADGDCKKTFYVKTNSSILAKKLTMTMTKGNLAATYSGNSIGIGFNVPDSYEVTIWYWNASTKKWVQEDNYDIYCKTSATIKLKKANTYYKILVDSYGAATTVKSYMNKGKIAVLNDMINGSNAYTYKWSKLPSWKIVNGANCTLYTTNPVK